MKKFVAILIFICSVVLAAGGTSACSGSGKNEDKIKIVTTVFSEYDWVMNVLGEEKDGAEVVLLLDSGADLHSYSPSVADMVKISSCDLFIYVGGESDEWVKDTEKNVTNTEQVRLSLLELLGDRAKEESHVEGMEHEHEEGEEHEHDETEYDEHVWLSLKNASVFVNGIAEALGRIDAENASRYLSNAAAYCDKLSALDVKYEEAVSEARVKTLLFADRFPFRYLVDDYGLNYYAAFSGCSAASEASFATIIFLAGKVDELGLTAIMKIESSDGSIARTVKNSTAEKNQRILTLDSLQSATKKEYAAGKNYISVMESNLEVLKAALA